MERIWEHEYRSIGVLSEALVSNVKYIPVLRTTENHSLDQPVLDPGQCTIWGKFEHLTMKRKSFEDPE